MISITEINTNIERGVWNPSDLRSMLQEHRPEMKDFFILHFHSPNLSLIKLKTYQDFVTEVGNTLDLDLLKVYMSYKDTNNEKRLVLYHILVFNNEEDAVFFKLMFKEYIDEFKTEFTKLG